MPATTAQTVSVVGIDIGKNSFHIVGLDDRGAIVLRQKWSRGQVEPRLANLPPCLIGMEPASGRIISAGSSRLSAMMLC
jgi:transposase